MKMTKMSVGVGVTVNLGNYQNIKAESMIEAEVERFDTPEDVERELNAQARRAVANQLSDYVLEVASAHLESCDDEADIKRLLSRSAVYEFVKNLEPQVAHQTKLLLVDEWVNWTQAQLAEFEPVQPADVTGATSEPVTITDLELQAEQASDRLDALLDELDAAPVVDPDLTNLSPDSEFFGEYPDEDYPDDDDEDDEDDQPEFDTEPDFDDGDDDLFDEDDVLDAHDDLAIAEAEVEHAYEDEATEPDTEAEQVEV